MTGISLWEIALVVLAVVVFVRPEDMPKFFRKAGQIYAEIQHYIRQVRSYTQEQFDQITRLEMERQNPPQPPPTTDRQPADDKAWSREEEPPEDPNDNHDGLEEPPAGEAPPTPVPQEGAPVSRDSSRHRQREGGPSA